MIDVFEKVFPQVIIILHEKDQCSNIKTFLLVTTIFHKRS